MEIILEQWIKPHMDISKWEYYDLSVKARDDTDDKVLHDAVAAGARLCAIFKEPTGIYYISSYSFLLLY
jgi:hypothetical protein